MRYSLFQLNILRFYREILKFAYTKPEPFRSQLKTAARKKFEENRKIPRTNIAKVFFLLILKPHKRLIFCINKERINLI